MNQTFQQKARQRASVLTWKNRIFRKYRNRRNHTTRMNRSSQRINWKNHHSSQNSLYNHYYNRGYSRNFRKIFLMNILQKGVKKAEFWKLKCEWSWCNEWLLDSIIHPYCRFNQHFLPYLNRMIYLNNHFILHYQNLNRNPKRYCKWNDMNQSWFRINQ